MFPPACRTSYLALVLINRTGLQRRHTGSPANFTIRLSITRCYPSPGMEFRVSRQDISGRFRRRIADRVGLNLSTETTFPMTKPCVRCCLRNLWQAVLELADYIEWLLCSSVNELEQPEARRERVINGAKVGLECVYRGSGVYHLSFFWFLYQLEGLFSPEDLPEPFLMAVIGRAEDHAAERPARLAVEHAEAAPGPNPPCQAADPKKRKAEIQKRRIGN
jgi:hypothetical protein